MIVPYDKTAQSNEGIGTRDHTPYGTCNNGGTMHYEKTQFTVDNHRNNEQTVYSTVNVMTKDGLQELTVSRHYVNNVDVTSQYFRVN